MRARVISETDARKGLLVTDTHKKMGYFDGCAQRTFEQHMCTKYEAKSAHATYTPNACNPSNRVCMCMYLFVCVCVHVYICMIDVVLVTSCKIF